MNNKYVDSTYLALELTKMSTSNCCDKVIVQDTFNYHLKELTGIEDIGIIKELQDTIDRLKQELKSASLVQGISIAEIEKLEEYINKHKGDMEPYIADTLLTYFSRNK